ncbi:MAG: VOC family protein [Chloroflexi bacterium]|nr:VOC family protein [Chloroflexota bacterium]
MFSQQVTFLYTADMAATAHFYGDVLGLPLVLEQPDCCIWQVTTEAFLGFCERESEAPVDGIIYTFVTQDVDGWHERLRAKGVTFSRAPQRDETYNIYHCFLRDPNGYLLEIQRFEDPFPA